MAASKKKERGGVVRLSRRAHKAGLRRRKARWAFEIPVRANRIRALFTLRNPEVVGSNPTPAFPDPKHVRGILRIFTVAMYVAAVALDLVSSLILLQLGYVEQNPLYGLLDWRFWLLKLVVSAGLLVLLLAYSKRWWWTYLILWIPTLALLICGVHNMGLL